jgi:Protein of unknown function (DUF3048) N-terminal domain/Protein of unknown function (DUF3048) C-terminal domain
MTGSASRFIARKQSHSPLFVLTLIVAALVTLTVVLPGCSWFGRAKKQEKKAVQAEAKPRQTTCPLCGLVVPGLPSIDRRPLAVKVENDPAARPQSGLNQADIVYEEVTEGGITRFMAIFLCRDVGVIGPVRSARPADIDLVFPYSALFCHCGGGEVTLSMIKASGIADLDQFAWPGAYWRSHDRRAPHNLYTSTDRLRTAGAGAFPFHGQVVQPFEFLGDAEQAKMESDRAAEIRRAAANQSSPSPTYNPAMTVVNNVHIPYEPTCAVTYTYDSGSGRFMRFVAGKPHVDRESGGQLAADSVIVQYVTETSSGIVDVRGAESPELGVLGSGRAQVFVRGRLIDANWQKNTRDELTRYTDNSGKTIKLKPGITWIELVPTTRQATFD